MKTILEFLTTSLPIVISVIALAYSAKAFKNGIREKIFTEQLNCIKELLVFLNEFSQFIDYNIPTEFREKVSAINIKDDPNALINIYL